jgi:glutathione synthase/RimK-type ligase-like ATP-grasp enzyme
MTADLCILIPEPSYKDYWHPTRDEYRALFGDRLDFRCWTEAGDLSLYRLIMPLIAWGYPKKPARWFALLDEWETAGLPFANPISLLRWNTDKDYLLDLQDAGLAVVPTVESHCLTNDDLAAARAQFGTGDLVIKPSISAGADGTYRLGPSDPIPFDVLEREMLIQPMMPAVASEGEFSLFYFGGRLSHSILKTPASGDFRVQEQFGGREVAVEAPAGAQTLAKEVLAAAPAAPLYARVDMVRDGGDEFRLMELEVIEPSLFLSFAADGGAAFAKAVEDWLSA